MAFDLQFSGYSDIVAIVTDGVETQGCMYVHPDDGIMIVGGDYTATDEWVYTGIIATFGDDLDDMKDVVITPEEARERGFIL